MRLAALRRKGRPLWAAETLDRTKRVIAYAVVTVMTSILLIPIAGMSWTYAMVAVVGGAWFVWEALRLQAAARRAEAAARPMQMFVVSNAYLALLFAAVAIDTLVKY